MKASRSSGRTATVKPAAEKAFDTSSSEWSSIPIYDHSLESVSKAFSQAGFTVAVRPLDLDAFMPVTVGSAYFPKVVDQLRYYSQDKVLFRFVRTP